MGASVRLWCCFPSPQMAVKRRLLPCACLGLLGVLCWVLVSGAFSPETEHQMEFLDASDLAAFQPQSALSDMEFSAVSSYRGPGNKDQRLNKELPILLWWSAGLFPHFPGDTERIDCATSSCMATSNRMVGSVCRIDLCVGCLTLPPPQYPQLTCKPSLSEIS